MKRFILSLLLLGATTLTAASTANPVTTERPYKNTQSAGSKETTILNALIEATEQNLKNQKELQTEIAAFQKLQGRYLADTDNTDLLFQTAKSAKRAYQRIEESRLENAFSAEFMKELKLFAQIAKKRGVPRTS